MLKLVMYCPLVRQLVSLCQFANVFMCLCDHQPDLRLDGRGKVIILLTYAI